MADVLSLKESVVVYLDRSGGFKRLADDCKHLNDPQRTEAVYKFCIRVNPSDLMEIDPLLGDLVLHNPLKATCLFQTVCFLAIKTLSLTEKIDTESQVNVTLNFTHLPPFPEYMLDLSRFPRVYGPMRPVCMEGFVIAMTRVTKYTQGARFLCTSFILKCFYGFRVPPHSNIFMNPFFFPLLCEYTYVLFGIEKQLVELIHAKALEALKGNQQSPLRYQSVTVFLRDELCNSMRIGRLYSVLGIPALVHQWPTITWNVEANNIQQSEPKSCCKLPTKFQELLNATASSPWRFSAIAAHCFGLEVAPPGLYNTVKLILLLSLAQTKTNANDTFQYLDLLVVTNDPLILDRLMAHSLRLACHGVRHQASGEMFASLSRDEHGAGAANIHAGSALLATGGVCMLGDISCYKKDKLDHIQSVLESHTASVFIPGKKFGEDADQLLSLPVQCSFWAFTDSSQRRHLIQSFHRGQETGPLPLQFSEAFGLVVECRERVGQQAQLAQTLHTLQQAVHPGILNYPLCWEFSTQDYTELVSYARDLQVELLPAAKTLIHGYYMASRRARTQSQGVKISVSSIKLISLAEAHCKLSLRTKVLEEDAVIAVLLCENAVTLKHGASTLFLPPEPTFPSDVGEADGLHKRDTMLDELHQSILRFIYTYAPGADTYITEE
uniref:Minichromosome maintenance domain-containing protein 2 n=1 Tax=Oryzias sinensis TaxID=183150 RepID=A0A8C7ZW13_9TELE